MDRSGKTYEPSAGTTVAGRIGAAASTVLLVVGIVGGGIFGWWIAGDGDAPAELASEVREPPRIEMTLSPPALSPPVQNLPPADTADPPQPALALPSADSVGDMLPPDVLLGDMLPDAPAVPPLAIANPGETDGSSVPEIQASDTPGWARYASLTPDNPHGKPLIAIVIDDVGANVAQASSAINMPGPITMAILPYAHKAAELAAAAREKGHEVLVHLPMEPQNGNDPGPNALLSGLTAAEFDSRLAWNLSQFDGYVGVNNHMGSRLTQNREAMEIVLAEVGRRGLIFLDSRTIALTVAGQLGREMGVATLERDIFIDNVLEPAEIRQQLQRLEATARRNGVAIAIGHPHRATLEALNIWMQEIQQRGFQLVPLSAVLKAGQPPRSVSLAAPGG